MYYNQISIGGNLFLQWVSGVNIELWLLYYSEKSFKSNLKKCKLSLKILDLPIKEHHRKKNLSKKTAEHYTSLSLGPKPLSTFKDLRNRSLSEKKTGNPIGFHKCVNPYNVNGIIMKKTNIDNISSIGK